MGDRGTMGHPPTLGSPRNPVRSLPRPRRVLVRGLGLSAERRLAVMLAAPDETPSLEDAPYDETPSMAWLHMAYVGPQHMAHVWDLLDHQPSAETLHLLSLVEFTDLLNGCSQELHETIGDAVEEKVYSTCEDRRRPQSTIHPATQRQVVRIRRFRRQLRFVQGPHACGQAP